MKTVAKLKRFYLLLFGIVFVASQLFLHLFAIRYVERLLVRQRLDQNEQLVRMALDMAATARSRGRDAKSVQPLLQEIASKSFFDSESFVCFINAGGYIVAHPDPTRIGMYRADQQIDTEAGPRPFTGEPGLVEGTWDNPASARTEIVSSIYDADLALTVAAHQNRALVQRKLATVRLYFSLFSTAVLVALFGAGWLSTRSLITGYVSEIERYEADLEAFNYSVAHDLRAPVRWIEGLGRALLEDHGEGLNEHVRGYLENVRGAARHMSRLIDDLLRLSQASRKQLSRGPVDLSRQADAVAAALCRREPGREVRFVVAPDVEVNGDPELLRIVLENLIGNAWKYTSRRPRAEIEFGVSAHRGGRFFFVRDDGVGFDMRDAKGLFDPFRRLHTSDEFEGTGIGLALVKRIVERHGGRVWAQAEVDHGASFYFSLP